MSVIADINANLHEPKIEDRIPKIARTKIELLPKARRNMRNVCLAILADEVAVLVDHRGSVVINSLALDLIDWHNQRQPKLFRKRLHELNGRPIRHWFGEVVPANRLLSAKVRPVENLLQTNDLRAIGRSLANHRDMLVEHRLLDRSQAALRRSFILRLDQRTSHDSRHRWPLSFWESLR